MPILLFTSKISISLCLPSLLLKVRSLIKIVVPFVLVHYCNAKTYAILNINQLLIGASFGQGKRWLCIVNGYFHSSQYFALQLAYPVTSSALNLRSIASSPEMSFVLPFAPRFMYTGSLHCGQYRPGCELMNWTLDFNSACQLSSQVSTGKSLNLPWASVSQVWTTGGKTWMLKLLRLSSHCRS